MISNRLVYYIKKKKKKKKIFLLRKVLNDLNNDNNLLGKTGKYLFKCFRIGYNHLYYFLKCNLREKRLPITVKYNC